MNAGIKRNCILLENDLLLDESVDLGLEEVALVDVVRLKLLVVFLQVSDILDDLFQNIIGSLSSVMLKSRALRSEELHFFLVVVQQFDGIFGVSLYSKRAILNLIITTYIKSIDSVFDWKTAGSEFAILAQGVHDTSHSSVGCLVVVLSDR